MTRASAEGYLKPEEGDAARLLTVQIYNIYKGTQQRTLKKNRVSKQRKTKSNPPPPHNYKSTQPAWPSRQAVGGKQTDAGSNPLRLIFLATSRGLIYEHCGLVTLPSKIN